MAWGDARRARIEARNERRKARQEGRTARAQARQETTQVMAKAGMRRGQVIGDVVSKGLDLASTRFGRDEGKGKSNEGGSTTNVAAMALPIVGLVAYMMSKKKKR